jgi:hypothetical protein
MLHRLGRGLGAGYLAQRIPEQLQKPSFGM